MTATAKGTTPAKRTTTTRQRAGSPPTPPGTQQPAASTVTGLGDPQTARAAQFDELQQQLDQMRAAAGLAARVSTRIAAPPPQFQLPATPPLPDPMTDPGYEPLRITSTATQPVGRHVMFYIDDQPFTVPNEVPFAVASEYMHRAAAGGGMGEIAATDYLLTELLGEEAYADLRACKSLTATQYAWIVSTCNRLAIGALELPKA